MVPWIFQTLLTTAIGIGGSVFTAVCHGQTPVQTAGTVVIVPAFSEIKHPNDEARAVFMLEEQNKDKAAAASRVNQKMNEGLAIIKREDPQALLKTHGYYTYPVYAEDQSRDISRQRQPAGWRVGHYLEMTTTNLNDLPKTVAAAQKVLALNGLSFGLTEASSKKLGARRIEAVYANLSERIAVIAKAMGRNPAEATLDTVDFDPSETYVPMKAEAASIARADMGSAPVAEPNFEPGETTLSMKIVGKVRFK